jgi:hypothetical protein
VRLPRLAGSKGHQSVYFLRSLSFKLLSQTKGNPVNNCYFLKLIISVRGGHCDFSPRALKSTVATPLLSAPNRALNLTVVPEISCEVSHAF